MDPKKIPPNKPEPAPADASQKVSPEVEAAARIESLKKQIVETEKKLRVAHGKITNRDPEQNLKYKLENEELVKRQTALERALLSLAMDSDKPRRAEDETLHYEILRKAVVDFCKNTNVDPELWKSIVS
ncbi:MAG: hypothetical protein AABZ55_11860 [Bdellovibrionota bacterium]